MKQYLFKFILPLGSVIAFIGCNEDAYPGGEEPTPARDTDKICFVVSEKSASRGGSSESRRVGGAFFYTGDRSDSIYVCLTVDEQNDIAGSRAAIITDIGETPIRVTCIKRTEEGSDYYFSNAKFTKDASGTWVSDPPQWWPNDNSSVNLKFYGYAPADATGTTYITDEQQTQQPKLDYHVPQDATQQTDILYNTPVLEYIASYNKTVPMLMAHALANVTFRTGTGTSAGTIDKVTIKNVLGHGTLNLVNGSWHLDPASITDFYATIGKVSSDNIDITTDADRTHFMLIPGCNSNESTVEIEFTRSDETKIYSGALTDTWEAGKRYRYTITINPDFDITVDADTQDAHFVICKATVHASNIQLGHQWELTATWEGDDPDTTDDDVTLLSDADLNDYQKAGFWTDRHLYRAARSNKFVDKGSARGSNKLTGSGDTPISIFLPENVSTKNRIVKLTLKVDNEPRAVLTKEITQLHPDWIAIEENGFGWEQIEEDPQVQWGFLWERIVTYAKQNTGLNATIYSKIISSLQEQYDPGMYYTTVTGEDFNQRVSIRISYEDLNTLQNFNFDDWDGYTNTSILYKFSGGATTGNLERAIKALAPGPGSYPQSGVFDEIVEQEDGNDPGNSVLKCILKKNRYNLKEIVEEQTDVMVSSYSANIANDIVWFLPAKSQFQHKPSTNSLDGDYWSSNPNGDNEAFTFFGSAGRLDRRKVRACRRPIS